MLQHTLLQTDVSHYTVQVLRLTSYLIWNKFHNSWQAVKSRFLSIRLLSLSSDGNRASVSQLALSLYISRIRSSGLSH